VAIKRETELAGS